MRAARVALLVALAAGAVAASRPPVAARLHATGGFPHQRHERVFPVCEGCHEGIVTGDASERFPSPADCARCHDGVTKQRITWAEAAPRTSLVRFSHVAHRFALEAKGESARCQDCHAAREGASRMDVAGPQPARCTTCHAHRATAHMAREAACATCHPPIAQATAVSAARIAAFPRPPWHAGDAFLTSHRADAVAAPATCATCHARESCLRCHLNGDRVAAVQSLAPDARIASLVKGRAPRYLAPASHAARSWDSGHGEQATRAIASCANCHSRRACSGCHRDPEGAGALVALAALPAGTPANPGAMSPRAAAGAFGDASAAGAAAAVHPADFARRHGNAAATNARGCAQCHSQSRCASCHAASDSRAFHPRNFSERHAASAFANGGECQSCHRSETFCRACHAGAGVATKGRMSAAYHDAQGGWLLSHGQAARKGLESCVACHAQADCMRCHSASSGWGVSPHRAGFTGERTASRSAASCRLCHSGNPAAGR